MIRWHPLNVIAAVSDQAAGTGTCRPIAASSRAIAVVMTLAGLPLRASLRCRAQPDCAFQAI
jgi:hypothetical protein